MEATSDSSRTTSPQSSKRRVSSTAYELFAYDFNPTAGGPIKKDKLWYFASFSANNRNGEVLDIYFKPNEPSTPAECRDRPVADPSQWCPATSGASFNPSQTVRVTHQVALKHKLRYSFDNTKFTQVRGNFTTGGSKVSPEASWYLPLYPTYLAQVKYTTLPTNRLLVEAGTSYRAGRLQDVVPARQFGNGGVSARYGHELVLRELLFELHV